MNDKTAQFPKLDRVIRSQRRLTIVNTFITFAFFVGIAVAGSSLVG